MSLDRDVSRRHVLAASMALGMCPGMHAQGPKVPPRPAPAKPEELWVPADPPNHPIGVGKGIHPGRVTWAHRPEATRWDGETERMSVTNKPHGEWWDDENCDPKIVEEMVSTSLQSLTGKKSETEAWDALFHHFNQTRNFPDAGYKPGEKLTIKVNFNNDRSTTQPWPSGRGMPSPQVLHSLVRQLVLKAGVPGKDIIIYDVANDRYISDPVYKRIRAEADPQFQDIGFVVNVRQAGNGRVAGVPNKTDPVRFSDPGLPVAFVPQCVVDAKYRINLALLRPHNIAGVTLTTKNNFGSIYWWDQDYWGPRPLHPFINKTRPMGSYNPLVDLMGHRQLGGKTMLYMIDGMYAAEECEINIVRFLSFGDKWTASLFLSQDPVAIDSVGLDFLRNEPRALPVRGNPDNFLHEAALVEKPPSGVAYEPYGARLSSLGVHEHWNSFKDKKYSRNLGTGEGIELLAV
jgi:hypothetical protein